MLHIFVWMMHNCIIRCLGGAGGFGNGVADNWDFWHLGKHTEQFAVVGEAHSFDVSAKMCGKKIVKCGHFNCHY